MTREEAIKMLKSKMDGHTDTSYEWAETVRMAIKALEQEPILGKIQKMKSEIADSLEFWDYSPNNNPLARDMLETLTNFWGDVKAESEE